ncbi:MAG: hypothetical protein M0P57_06295 [Syntrophales bacterium]|jgi:hypothetical protein|nr:hypothetical protein [Syntrophales bacterium]MDY0043624.1 hypothetical protein [Syntrophales bacterium]
MNRYDNLQIRCPKLGGEITFAYCRIEQGTIPCRQIIGCWHTTIPIESYLEEVFSRKLLDQYLNVPSKDKITTIFEIVDSLKNKP